MLINFLLIVLGKISGDVSVHETIYMLVCAGDKMVSVCMSRCVYVCAMPLTLLLLYFKLSLGCLSEAPGVLSRFRFCIPSWPCSIGDTGADTGKRQIISHKFSTGWAVGVVKIVEKKKSVAGQFAVKYYKSETYG